MNKRGVSLIELIIALSLVGLIIIFLFGLLPSTGLLAQQSEQQMAAASYGDELLARLDSMSFETLQTGQGTLTPDAPGILGADLEERTLNDSTKLTPEVQIRSLPPTDHLLQCTVVVRWKTRRRSLEHRIVRNFASVNR